MPVLVDTFDAVTVGQTHACGLLATSLYCWGDNLAGQLGVGDTSFRTSPTQVDGSWSSVSAGNLMTCAIRDDDSLWCWGDSERGELGVGEDATTRDTPAQVLEQGPWRQVVAGQYHACGIKSEDSLWCWGSANRHGVAGESSDLLQPGHLDPGTEWESVTVHANSSCAIRSVASRPRVRRTRWGASSSAS